MIEPAADPRVIARVCAEIRSDETAQAELRRLRAVEPHLAAIADHALVRLRSRLSESGAPPETVDALGQMADLTVARLTRALHLGGLEQWKRECGIAGVEDANG